MTRNLLPSNVKTQSPWMISKLLWIRVRSVFLYKLNTLTPRRYPETERKLKLRPKLRLSYDIGFSSHQDNVSTEASNHNLPWLGLLSVTVVTEMGFDKTGSKVTAHRYQHWLYLSNMNLIPLYRIAGTLSWSQKSNNWSIAPINYYVIHIIFFTKRKK